MRNSVNAMPDAILILSGNWQLQWLNKSAEHLFDIKFSHDFEKKITDLIEGKGFREYIEVGDFKDHFRYEYRNSNVVHLEIRVIQHQPESYLLHARDVTLMR